MGRSIIMEYMDRNLRKLMDSRLEKRNFGANVRPFELHEEELIISKIALGMAYLHSRGLVHRDLKPTNLLAQEHSNGIIEVKIVDFGLSHLVELSSESSDTQAIERFDSYYTGVGRSSFYGAPELLSAPPDPSEDFPRLGLLDKTSKINVQALKAAVVHSFAMACYEVLTGNSLC